MKKNKTIVECQKDLKDAWKNFIKVSYEALRKDIFKDIMRKENTLKSD